MGYFWLFALAAFIALDKAHRMDIDSTIREHQFRLYMLRDELREAAMKKQIDPKNWIFLYLDSSLAKTISVLGRITVWHVLLTGLTSQKDESARRAVVQLQTELSKPANATFRDFHNKYVSEVGLFLVDRHKALKITLFNLLAVIRVGQYLHRQGKRLLEYQMATRETSTLRDFVHA